MEILTKQISFPIYFVIFYNIVFILILIEMIRLSVQKMFSKVSHQDKQESVIPWYEIIKNNPQYEDVRDRILIERTEDNKKGKPLAGREIILYKGEYPQLFELFKTHGITMLLGYDLIWE